MVSLFMEIIEAGLKPDHQKNQQAYRNTRGQPEDINDGISFTDGKITEGDSEVVF